MILTFPISAMEGMLKEACPVVYGISSLLIVSKPLYLFVTNFILKLSNKCFT